ncbi:MAG: serine hydrolase [Ignavibacteriaceae bacterium]|nr:serine hydrolase [Ignavibacteriaceae bacterium]
MIKTLSLFILLINAAISQNLYFPPVSGGSWETVSPSSMGWDTTKLPGLCDFLESKNSKAFIVLKDGRIVIEKYFDTFTADSIWYWASAGKTLTAFLTGQAVQEGKLKLTDTTSSILGDGWTSLTQAQERKITILNQLTMTTGLNDFVADPYCTLPECLIYKAEAGTRWAYHNAPYTLLDSVLMKRTGLPLNQYFQQKIRSRIGMNGLWVKQGYNNVYFSSPRSMARFGLLVLNKGIWNNDTLLADTVYFRSMVNTSQSINKSYGYLWWLNGKESYMLPQTQFVFPGSYAPDAPADMFSALGKNGQILSIAPSSGLVVLRMGDVPDSSSEVPTTLSNSIWKELNKVMNPASAISDEVVLPQSITLSNYPNPFNPSTNITFSLPSEGLVKLEVYNTAGEKLKEILNEEREAGTHTFHFSGSDLATGVYLIRLTVYSREQGRMIFTGTVKSILLK